MRGTRVVVATIVGVVAVVLAACGISGPDATRRLGVIAFHGDSAHVVSPDTVEVDVEFSVSVRTYGGGCTEKGDTEVAVVSRVITVRPYDIETGHATCAGILLYFDHEAAAVVSSAGTVLLQVYGREEPGDSLIIVERQLVAR